MDRSKYKILSFAACLLPFVFSLCGTGTPTSNQYPYKGTVDVTNCPALKEKRIFIDPGHGGTRAKDPFRVGPTGLAEEEVNLKVALILADMLKRAGAVVELARTEDVDSTMEVRVKMAEKFKPDLLISIHHNGTIRKNDGVNFPMIFVWASESVNPQSVDFAKLLLQRFEKMMDIKGLVVSDFSVFHETGSYMLRSTSRLCTGILVEPCFFSDGPYEAKLKTIEWNMREAEEYFSACADYFTRGVPTAKLFISARFGSEGNVYGVANRNAPLILDIAPGAKGAQVDPSSFEVSDNCVPVAVRKISATRFLLVTGELYGGMHRIRIAFKNTNGAASPLYSCFIAISPNYGEYSSLSRNGLALTKSPATFESGIRMLACAYTFVETELGADKLLFDIASAYQSVHDDAHAAYWWQRLYAFYPQSSYRKKVPAYIHGLTYPTEYYGTPIVVEHKWF